MDCTKCVLKGCRASAPCSVRSGDYLGEYLTDDNQARVKAASALVDGGRAGTLSRLEEIVEYMKTRGIRAVGVAYCYGLEKEAVLLRERLDREGFRPHMVSCTVDGVTESQLDPDKAVDAVSCNPLGQAHRLNSAGVELTVLMGLCLGHDILLQKNLSMDFTTFVVKDRVFGHNPLLALHGDSFPEDAFLEGLDGGFGMVKTEELRNRLSEGKSPEDFYLLDLRGAEAHRLNGLPGSVNCLLTDLPKQYKALLPDKNMEIIVCCNGGIQSVYAVMFLSLKGYRNVRSLAGGLSKYLQE